VLNTSCRIFLEIIFNSEVFDTFLNGRTHAVGVNFAFGVHGFKGRKALTRKEH
jgi:hypothetical protein